MKAPKLVLACLAMSISVVVFGQTDTTKRDTTKRDTTTRRDTTRKDSLIQGQQAESASSMQQSQPQSAQKKFPTPNAGRNYIPVLGSFQSANADNETKSIVVSADEKNAGKIWIEGLATGKFYALLKALPGTYKIPAQHQEDKPIPEGMVQYDEETKQINVCLGCGYSSNKISDDASTTMETTETVKTSKTAKGVKSNKAKTVINFSGTKVEQGTVSTNQ
ncbi:MAG: hypothetical protein WKF97_07660 [Chitinophagaceae bacterium]